MALENVVGGLLAYKKLEPGTLQHADQLTTERITNHGLRIQFFYTADGELYTFQKGKHLWAIIREPQNLVLGNIDEAYQQLINQGNYFPDAEAARASLDHGDTVVVDLKGLELVKDADSYGHFVINPKKIKQLNSEQIKAAQRIYGPDNNNFGLNMEMFAEAGKNPRVFVLLPDYVQGTLKSVNEKFLGRASWLGNFYGDSSFGASGRGGYNHDALRGVRRRVLAEGDAPKNEAPQEIGQEKPAVVTLERMLELSRPHVADSSWPIWENELRKEYK